MKNALNAVMKVVVVGFERVGAGRSTGRIVVLAPSGQSWGPPAT